MISTRPPTPEHPVPTIGLPGPRRLRPPARILLLLGITALLAQPAAPAPASPSASGEPEPSWQAQVGEGIRRAEYGFTWQEASGIPGLEAAWHAPNRAHDLRSWFTPSGLRIVPRTGDSSAWELGLELAAYGRGQSTEEVAPAELSPLGGRMELHRDGITEWYLNTPEGLKQGFTLEGRPGEGGAGSPAGEVHLSLELKGTLAPRLSPGGRAIDFHAGAAGPVLRYAELRVFDAAGKELRAWMELARERGRPVIRILFDDTEAVYPVTVDPLLSSPAWSAESDQANATLGHAVATAGDINGDGYSDLIVGAPLFDNGQANEGRAYLYEGGATGPALAASWILESDQAGAQLGWSVATAGDVNGDGLSDVIIGARLYDNVESSEGLAVVFHGAPSGLAGAPVAGIADAQWTVEGDDAFDQLGISVAPAGDVNGDGYGDVIIGQFFYDNVEADEGRALVFHGSASGLPGGPSATPSSAAWTAESNQASALFGEAVAPAGDVNGDGYADVIVGARQYDNVESQEGAAFVFHGSASGLAGGPAAGPGDAAWTVEADQADAQMGFSVATAGDVNGDGYADVIVGSTAWDNVESNEGRALVFHGSGTGLTGGAGAVPADADWAAESDQALALFGHSVAPAGDVNGDGYADVLVGARVYDNGQVDEGAVFLYQGSASGLPGGTGAGRSEAAWISESDQADARLGYSVATAGDVNGDGFSDVIAGARLYDNAESDEGGAFLWLGAPGGLAGSPQASPSDAGWSVGGGQASANLGSRVASAGDINGDGFGDVVVSAPDFDNGQAGEGMAFVFHGSSGGLPATADWTMESNQAFAQFPSSVGSAGDVNGDGYGDLILGSRFHSIHPVLQEGAAFVVLGSAFGLPGGPSADPNAAHWVLDSGQDGSNLGFSVATAGDVNGDGFSDVIAGAPAYWIDPNNVIQSEGAAFVFHGSPAGLPGGTAALATMADWTLLGTPDSLLGFAVSTAGDVNGDGWSDVIIGAPFYDGPFSVFAGGGAFVFHGSASGLSGGPQATTADYDWVLEADSDLIFLGTSVAAAGDIDGDGYGDVLIGAPEYIGQGLALAYAGTPTGLFGGPTTQNFLLDTLWQETGTQTGESLGASVASAGDVNGDGYSDILIGASDWTSGESNEGKASLFLGDPISPSFIPDWTLEGQQAFAGLGGSVASAGDVNGDGFSDIIVGAEGFDNGLSGEGTALVFYGNGGGRGWSLTQRRADDAAPVAPLGASESPDSFRMELQGARSPFGRGELKVEWSWGALPLGAGSGLSPAWTDSAATVNELITGLVPGASHGWEARLLYNPATTPFQQAGPWREYVPGAGPAGDIRTPVDADLSVTVSDESDPVFGGNPIVYDLGVQNSGSTTVSPLLVVDLPTGATFVSAVPSQGNCFHLNGRVTCGLGSLSGGSSATVTLTLTAPPGGGLLTGNVQVSPLSDLDPNNNTAQETTTTVELALGDRIWEDLDGNGVQDPNEPGMAGVYAILLDPNGVSLDVTQSDATGSYKFTNVTFGESYSILFFPPITHVLAPQDQGGDDLADSDADALMAETPLITLTDLQDPVRWDVGLVPSCLPPDEAIFVESVSLGPSLETILSFQDFNQPGQVTGYNIYRSDTAATPPGTWPLLASDVVDGDAGTPNNQWADTTGNVSPTGMWYYTVTAFNSRCPAQGPF